MKEFWNAHKWPLLIGINTLPFALNILFYRTGCMDDLLLFLPVFFGLTVLNYRSCGSVPRFLALQACILIWIIASGYAATCLYYEYVSHDGLTPVVGMLFVFLEMGVDLVATTVFALEKKSNKNVHNTKIRREADASRRFFL